MRRCPLLHSHLRGPQSRPLSRWQKKRKLIVVNISFSHTEDRPAREKEKEATRITRFEKSALSLPRSVTEWCGIQRAGESRCRRRPWSNIFIKRQTLPSLIRASSLARNGDMIRVDLQNASQPIKMRISKRLGLFESGATNAGRIYESRGLK